MHALLKLVKNSDDARRLLAYFEARDIQLANREHGETLTREVIDSGGFSVDYGGYGRKITLGTGKSFASKWTAITHEKLFDSKKPFANVAVSLHQSVPQLEGAAISAFVTKNGGVINPDGETDLLIHALKPREASTAISGQVIRADLNGFLEVFPRVAKALEKSLEAAPSAKDSRLKKAKITAEQIAAFEEIKLLLADKDLTKVNEGLLRARELFDHLDHLLAGLKIKDGELSEAGLYRQLGWKSHRDFIVYNLLSMAPEYSKAAKIRSSITKVRCSGINSSPMPILKGFDSLESLSIAEGKNSHLVDRSLSLEAGYSSCSEFSALTCLSTSAPVDGLCAPMLDEMVLRTECFDNLKSSDIPASATRLSLLDIPSLSNLEFLAGHKSIQRIYIADCPALRDISALASLPALTHAVIKAEIETPPAIWPESLVHLEAEGWVCEVLGQLPSCLTHFSIDACTSIKNLLCIEHCTAPFTDHALGINVTNREKIVNVRTSKESENVWFDFESGNYSSLGVLPAGHLRLGDCPSLVSLEGLTSGCGLKQIHLPSHPIDVSSLKDVPEAIVVIGKRSENVIKSLSCLPRLRLRIHSKSLDDLEFLEPLYHTLVALDLTQVSSVKDVSAVIKMENLAELKIDGRSDNPAMAQLKKSRFTSKGQIDAFRLEFMAGS